MDAILSDRARRMAEEMAGGVQTADDLREVMRMMTKTLMEKALDAEMDVHLGRKQVIEEGAAVTSPLPAHESSTTGRKNRRNGRSAKTVQGELGEVTIATPRDRAGSFEPQLVPKYQRRMPGFDEKVLALYAKGMSTRDIEELLKQLYGVEVSPTLISAVTDAVDEEVTAWRSRPLDAVWPIVYFDGIVVHVRGANSRVSQHTVYVAIGVNLEGHKDLLGLWLAESEGAKFWLSVLTDMKNRGLNDIFVACIDGLTGFADAIRTVFEDAKVQLCVVHLVRAALRYVADKDSKAVARDLKNIYNAATLTEAETALEEFASVWDEKYPTISKSWRAKWPDIITLFDFPWPIRKAISTTNAIESVNSVIRKLTRNRKIYPNESSVLKIMYMAIREASKKWTMPVRNWKSALNHFAILYEDRLPTNQS
ncbi:MAG: IS256 family transposase [Planctomycetes bacterium]|jgi:transposase-like protein|nr:IS256 family transposase [Planctomycetota bacterium]